MLVAEPMERASSPDDDFDELWEWIARDGLELGAVTEILIWAKELGSDDRKQDTSKAKERGTGPER